MKYCYLLIAIVAFTTNSCTVSKSRNYAYKINTYSIADEKNLFSSTKLLSYRGYLFEFIMQVNFSDTITAGQERSKSGINYTTNGFYILSNKSDSFFLFDKFSLNNKLIKSGKASEKEFGLKIQRQDNQHASNPALYKTLPVDTIINNTKCYYIDINLSLQNIDSTAYAQKIFLFRDKNFVSYYKLQNANYLDPKYCIIGIYFFDKNKQQGFVEEPEAVRFLTKEELQICRESIKKIRF
jgi:hypothetical protein